MPRSPRAATVASNASADAATVADQRSGTAPPWSCTHSCRASNRDFLTARANKRGQTSATIGQPGGVERPDVKAGPPERGEEGHAPQRPRSDCSRAPDLKNRLGPRSHGQLRPAPLLVGRECRPAPARAAPKRWRARRQPPLEPGLVGPQLGRAGEAALGQPPPGEREPEVEPDEQPRIVVGQADQTVDRLTAAVAGQADQPARARIGFRQPEMARLADGRARPVRGDDPGGGSSWRPYRLPRRRRQGDARAGGSQPASARLRLVPGGTIWSIRSRTLASSTTSAAPS